MIDNVPLYKALMGHKERAKYSFHVPGHKSGKVFPNFARREFESLLPLDQTELSGLDDLHDPSGAIAEAQQKTALFYGAMSSYFLVGGTTSGNLAMILSICGQGDTVLVQRNSHKSILNGIRLAKATPVFLTPEFDRQLGLATAVNETTLREALIAYPEAKAVILTHPNYYGVTSDLSSLIELAHRKKIPVLVDEAHGAHFVLGEPFPRSALAEGADIVVHSAHKTLPAMTMASFLHYNSKLVDKETLEMYLQMLQSSSPSYPLMASLDLARHYLSKITADEINTLLKSIQLFKRKLSTIPQILVVDSEEVDPLKVIVESRCEASGFELQKSLEEKGIFVELADESRVLLVLPLTPLNGVDEMIECWQEAVQSFNIHPKRKDYSFKATSIISTLALNYDEMKSRNNDITIVSLEESSGWIFAEDIIPYPPGIPVILKGERATEQDVKQLLALAKQGARFQGRRDILTNGVKIYR
ncbi:MAG TPA: aminotransferase class V-fold PLP-dependent enzyme [Bacilli bacterium]|nr:aminotransferase class V-fold PLP-dependent enzyme [Bacilli bacterium]